MFINAVIVLVELVKPSRKIGPDTGRIVVAYTSVVCMIVVIFIIREVCEFLLPGRFSRLGVA